VARGIDQRNRRNGTQPILNPNKTANGCGRILLAVCYTMLASSETSSWLMRQFSAATKSRALFFFIIVRYPLLPAHFKWEAGVRRTQQVPRRRCHEVPDT
jgi:hypothetical protein